ncbi:ATP-binding cassette domain-containing protein [Nocardioides sp. GY 10113]|uniref:ABC transporter permease subunit n=1 Tax=Nocardioides sp. GY 10113 TaxID=2569761 RepID=UPI0010A7791C|nr:branched-chain amino acid ABC transporter permease/ATP-binding protein [Nocardioides sp. GY 10113]TIC88875.1 ATP-binding cassette domain-containing protein [Nocardioides sp. GY 10113]
MAGFDLSGTTLFLGVLSGIPIGLLAIGLTLVYRVSRFVNFAQGALGVFGASVVGTLVVVYHLPYWLAFALGIGAAALAGAMAQVLVVRRVASAPHVVGVVVTLALAQFLLALSFTINTKATAGPTFPLPPGLPSMEVGGVVASPAYTALLVLGPLVALAVWVVLTRTPLGLAIRATATNPDATWTSGVSPSATATATWALAGAVAAFSATLLWPTQGIAGIATLGPSLLLRGLAAAVIARFTHVGVAFVAGVVIGLLDTVARTDPSRAGLADIVLAVVVLVWLLLLRPPARSTQVETTWSATRLPAVDARYRHLPEVRHLPVLVGLLVTVTVATLPLWRSNAFNFAVLTTMALAIVVCSVALLTGMAGVLSLGQVAVAGVGAVVSVRVASAAGGNVLLGILCGAAAGAVVGLVLGLPALRNRPMALEISSLAFAVCSASWLFRQEWAFGIGVVPDQPMIGTLALDGPKSYLYVVLVVLLAVGLGLRWVWTSRFGRELRAARDNEPAARALGVRVRRLRALCFLAAGAIAGLGGAVLAHSRSYLSAADFDPGASITVVTSTVAGGLGTIGGPIAGATLVQGVPLIGGLGSLAISGLTLLVLVLIVLQPAGLAGVLVPVRDWVVEELGRLRGIRPGWQEPAQEASAGKPADPIGADGGAPVVPVIATSGGAPRMRTPEPGRVVLEVDGVSRSFGGVRAVNGVDLRVLDGELVGIVGANGAGKTTLFEIVTGFVVPDAGSVRLLGEDVTRRTPEARCRRGLVRSFQNALLFPSMTVREVVDLALRDRDATAGADELLSLVGIADLAEAHVDSLTTGNRRMVELAAALATHPQVLLLDEPGAGVSHAERERLAGVLRGLRDELGLTVVVIDHDLGLLRAVCDRLVAMDQGAVIAAGDPQEVLAHADVLRAYLGEVDAAGSAVG